MILQLLGSRWIAWRRHLHPQWSTVAVEPRTHLGLERHCLGVKSRPSCRRWKKRQSSQSSHWRAALFFILKELWTRLLDFSHLLLQTRRRSQISAVMEVWAPTEMWLRRHLLRLLKSNWSLRFDGLYLNIWNILIFIAVMFFIMQVFLLYFWLRILIWVFRD